MDNIAQLVATMEGESEAIFFWSIFSFEILKINCIFFREIKYSFEYCKSLKIKSDGFIGSYLNIMCFVLFVNNKGIVQRMKENTLEMMADTYIKRINTNTRQINLVDPEDQAVHIMVL